MIIITLTPDPDSLDSYDPRGESGLIYAIARTRQIVYVVCSLKEDMD